jgi:CDGSH-type Zn-finger protein
MTKKKENIKVEKGQTYFLCTCAHSKKYPFCDGSHRSVQPDKKSMPYTAEETCAVEYSPGQKPKKI